jgi:hypothetical protein
MGERDQMSVRMCEWRGTKKGWILPRLLRQVVELGGIQSKELGGTTPSFDRNIGIPGSSL